MSPGLARYLAFSGKASWVLRVSLWAAAIRLRVSPDFTVTVTIGGRRIAFAPAMTRLTRCSRVAGGQGSPRLKVAVELLHEHIEGAEPSGRSRQ
jgi:hypothetical protein